MGCQLWRPLAKANALYAGGHTKAQAAHDKPL
jgi:prepilin-type processing-associated H-X9-DG protein